MTVHVHDSSTCRTDEADGTAPAVRSGGSTRPRWFLPAVAGGLVVVVLVAYGVLSPAAVLYGGLFGGMLLMHRGGHGNHGGHGAGPDHAPPDAEGGSEPESNAERGSHGCH